MDGPHGPARYVTQNRGKAEEVLRLLAPLPLAWERLPLAHVTGDDLEVAASARVREAFARLRAPCFLENTGLWVHTRDEDDDGEEPAFPPRTFKRVIAALGSEAAFCARYGGARVRARVAVAYADDDTIEPRVFSGEIAGRIASAPRGEAGYGWDRVFVAEGYARTLSELAGSKYLANMRLLPYLELAEVLRGRSYEGTFEAHVTIAAGDDDARARFAAACDELGVKSVFIELPRGVSTSQPMTASYHRGELRAVQAEVLGLASELVRRGFVVTRTKIEAVGRNRDVPEDDAEARARPKDNYFEYHVKVHLPRAASADNASDPSARLAGLSPLGRLARLADAHDAHLSRSARATLDGATETRFVTLRIYGRGRVESSAQFDALLAALAAEGYKLGTRLREYAVYDSDVTVDAGWIEAP